MRGPESFLCYNEHMKKFKTIKEQIEILKNRGLSIQDESLALKILLERNYYILINSFGYIFKNQDDSFVHGATLEGIEALYVFDLKLRSIVLPKIFIIEEKTKALLAYYFSANSTSFGKNYREYFQESNFNCNSKKKIEIYQSLKGRADKILKEQKDDYIKHYLNKYGTVPFWVLVKSLSIGNVSSLLNIAKQPVLQEIVKHYDELSEREIVNYFAFLTLFRNESAHNKRIFSLKYRRKKIPTRSKRDENAIVAHFKKTHNLGLNDFFALMIIFKRMLTTKDFEDFFHKLSQEMDFLEESILNDFFVKIKKEMGLPRNWEEIIHL